jgi:hypothetical protein
MVRMFIKKDSIKNKREKKWAYLSILVGPFKGSTTLSITTFGITTLSITASFATISPTTLSHYAE